MYRLQYFLWKPREGELCYRAFLRVKGANPVTELREDLEKLSGPPHKKFLNIPHRYRYLTCMNKILNNSTFIICKQLINIKYPSIEFNTNKKFQFNLCNSIVVIIVGISLIILNTYLIEDLTSSNCV